MEPALQDFQKQNPHLKIDYQNQSSTDYRQRLQTTLSSKNPPDVVRLHSTWLPTFASLLQSAPQSLLSPSDLNSSFYPVVSDQVVLSNQVYGLPFTLDSLVLFVNHDLLQTAQSTVPTNWLDLQKLARRLTKTNPNTGQISQAGLSLGTTTNVDHWPDIVSLMLVQNGVDLGNLDSEKTLEALKFYLLFTTSQNPTWSPALPNSTQAFASGKLVFYIAPSWKIPTIQQVNPDFDWQTHPVPQLPQAPLANWASFWVEAVPKNAKNPQQAWQLIKYLSSTQAQQTIFQSATQVRGYAQPPSNKNLKNKISTNPLVSPVLEQLSSAQTFYTVGATHDGSTGINSRLIKYLEDALNALTKNPNDSQVMETLQKGFTQVLSQYQLNSTP